MSAISFLSAAMRSQEECPDASKHASKDTGILIPASDASHDLKTTLPRSRKRKRYESPVADLLDDAFIVKVRCRVRHIYCTLINYSRTPPRSSQNLAP
jgi:hypothetical protein